MLSAGFIVGHGSVEGEFTRGELARDDLPFNSVDGVAVTALFFPLKTISISG